MFRITVIKTQFSQFYNKTENVEQRHFYEYTLKAELAT